MSLLNRGEAGDSGAGQGAALLLNKRQSWESDMDMVQSAKAEADRKAAERERKRLEREKVAAASAARRSVLRTGIVKMTGARMMASGAMGKFRLLIVPGSGCPDLESKHHFYKWAVQAFDDRAYFDVVECLPMCGDPSRPDEGAWAAHMKDALSANHKTVVLGHDMGAAAGLRLLEDGGRLAGLVMVGGPRAAHHRDMIYASSDGRPTAALLEAAAEVAPVHYLRQRNWPAIKAGVGQFGVVVIHAADDPDVPVAEAGAVVDALGLDEEDLQVLPTGRHFIGGGPYPDLVRVVGEKLGLWWEPEEEDLLKEVVLADDNASWGERAKQLGKRLGRELPVELLTQRWFSPQFQQQMKDERIAALRAETRARLLASMIENGVDHNDLNA